MLTFCGFCLIISFCIYVLTGFINPIIGVRQIGKAYILILKYTGSSPVPLGLKRRLG